MLSLPGSRTHSVSFPHLTGCSLPSLLCWFFLISLTNKNSAVGMTSLFIFIPLYHPALLPLNTIYTSMITKFISLWISSLLTWILDSFFKNVLNTHTLRWLIVLNYFSSLNGLPCSCLCTPYRLFSKYQSYPFKT